MSKNSKKWGVICDIFIALNIIVTLVIIASAVYIFGFNKLEVKKYYRYQQINVPEMKYTLTKDEVRKLVADLYNTPHIYKEVDVIAKNRMAESFILLRLVRIRKDLDIGDYAVAYAHELAHVKYMIGDETNVSFKSFVMLYESGNAELQNMALREAKYIIKGSYKGTKYDCGYYIIEYLKEKGVIYGR